MAEPQSHLQTDPVGPLDPGALDVEGVRRRDSEALDQFFGHFFERLFALSYRLTGERTRAEDLTQEVFLRVYRFADTLDAKRDPWPWLATIAHRCLADRTRRGDHRLHRRAVSMDEKEGLAASLTSAASSPSEALEASEEQQAVRDQLDLLPDAQRTVIVLRDWEGLSHKEIAEITSRSEVATRKLYSRAIAALGDALKEARR